MSYLRDVAATIRANLPAGTSMPNDGDSLFLLYAVLLRTKGESVTAGDVHEAWVAWMELRGEEHESMVPFDDLTKEVQAEDLPFAEAIADAARLLG